MSDCLNFALIGCGGMMRAHLRGFAQLWEHDIRNFRIVACCDINQDAANSLADDVAEFQGTRPDVYTSVDDLLDRADNIDACDISVLHREHHTVAVPCLQAGKHVLIEKPLGITMRAAKAILDAAAEAGVKLGVAENYRRAPHERAIQWAIEQGRIGEPWMVFWIDAGLRLWYWTWREHRMEAGAGWTLDGGVHFADLFRYHIGPVDEAYAVTRKFWPYRYSQREPLGGDLIEVDVEDCMIAILKFQRPEVVGQWTLTSEARGLQWGRRAIYGSEGCIDWSEGLRTDKLNIALGDLVTEFMSAIDADTREKMFPRGITDSVAQELNEFVEACLYDRDLETDGLEGYKAEAICYAVYESAQTGRPVKVADVEALSIEEYQRDINESLGLA